MSRIVAISFLLLNLVLSSAIGQSLTSEERDLARSLLAGVGGARMSLQHGSVVYEVDYPEMGDYEARPTRKVLIEWNGNQYRTIVEFTNGRGVAERSIAILGEKQILTHANNDGGSKRDIEISANIGLSFDPRLLGVRVGLFGWERSEDKLKFPYWGSPVKIEAVESSRSTEVFRLYFIAEDKSEYTMDVETNQHFWVHQITDERSNLKWVSKYESGGVLPVESSALPIREDEPYIQPKSVRQISIDLSREPEPATFGIEGLQLDIGDEFLDVPNLIRVGYWDGQTIVERKQTSYQNAFDRGDTEIADSSSGSRRWIGLGCIAIAAVGLIFYFRRS